MKKNTNLLINVFLFITIILMSVTTTLALIQDNESKVGNILKFDKVSIMGDSENGSHLSIKLDKENVGFGQDVIGGVDGGNSLLIRPTSDTAEMYVRFRIYFTLGDEKLDKQNFEALTALNKKGENGVLDGLVLKNDGVNYRLTVHEDWVYITAIDEVRTNLLKVITRNDNLNGFLICEEYKLNYDMHKEYLIMSLQEEFDVFLKVQVDAIQCENLVNTIEGIEDNFNSSEILVNGNEENLEEKFGYATIETYIKGVEQNIGKSIELTKGISFTELDYVQSNGSQSLDTGYYANQNTTSETEFSYLGYSNEWSFIWGNKVGTNYEHHQITNSYFIYFHNNIFTGFGTGNIHSIKEYSMTNSNIKYNVKQTKTEAEVFDLTNNKLISNFAILNKTNFVTHDKITVFSLTDRSYYNNWVTNSCHVRVKLYNLKFMENSYLVRKFIPAKSSDGSIGLFDSVTNKFYNTFQGKLVAGGIINQKCDTYYYNVMPNEVMTKGKYRIEIDDKYYTFELNEDLYANSTISDQIVIIKKNNNEMPILQVNKKVKFENNQIVPFATKTSPSGAKVNDTMGYELDLKLAN